MGKTESGAVWLDPEKTSPYEFFQYWRNVGDADVQNCMKLLTDIPMDEINAVDMNDSKSINAAKEKLAYALTAIVHSEQAAEEAMQTARNLFANNGQSENMPTTEISDEQLQDGKIGLLDLMFACGIIPSKGEGRRLIQQGGVSVDDDKVADPTMSITQEELQKGIVIKKGKKVYHRAVLR